MADGDGYAEDTRLGRRAYESARKADVRVASEKLETRAGTYASLAFLIVAIAIIGFLADHDLDGRALDLEFAGTGDQLRAVFTSLSSTEGLGHRPGLGDFFWDFVLIGVYTLGGLTVSLLLWPPRRSRFIARWSVRLALVIAGLADIAENIVTARARQIDYDWAAPIIFSLASLKWVLVVAVLVAAIVQLASWAYKVPERLLEDKPANPTKTPASDWPPIVFDHKRASVGIACSGGGIRSAAFSLGGLHGLGASRVREATHLAAVSGGSYIATAMTAHYHSDDSKYQGDKLPFAEGSPELKKLRARSKYLFADGTGGRTSIGRALLATGINVIVLWLVAFAVLRPVGWLISSPVLHPELRSTEMLVDDIELAADLKPGDFRITAMPTARDDAAVPPTVACEDGVEARHFEIRMAHLPQFEAHVLRSTNGKSNPYRKAFHTRLDAPGVIEVCGTTPRVVRQPHLTTREPFKVNDQMKLKYDDEGGISADTATAISQLKSWLKVDEQPDFGDRTGIRGRSDIAIDGWMWAVVAIGLLACALVTTLGKGALRNRGRMTLRFPVSGAVCIGAATIVFVGMILIPWLLREIPDAVNTSFGKKITPSSPTGRLAAWATLFGGAFAAARRASATIRPLASTFKRFGLTAVKVLAFAISTALGAGLAYGILQHASLNGPKGRLGGFGSTWWGAELPDRLWLDFFKWVVVVALLLGVRPLIRAQTWALQPLYRDRLANAFFDQPVVTLDSVLSTRPATAPSGSKPATAEAIDGTPTAAPKGKLDTDLSRMPMPPGVAVTQAENAPTDKVEPVDDEKASDGKPADEKPHDAKQDAKQPKPWPLLMVCATVNFNDPATQSEVAAGRFGQSFLFAQDVIGWPDHYAPTTEYAARLSKANRNDLALESIVAMSGAAFSPAMGKFGFGPIGGLFAIVNLRLGLWMPNPDWVEMNPAPYSWKRIAGWPYLMREIWGRFRKNNPYVFVTDGGHWENLGMVELLRRGCDEIYVISAAGDGGQSFSTIAEAIALARQVVPGVEIDVDLTPLRAPVGAESDDDRQLLDLTSDPPSERTFAPRTFAIGTLEYPAAGEEEPRRGVILFVEANLSAAIPWDVQAWGERRPRFPDDSTGDQFFDFGQFESYRRLGEYQVDNAVNSDEWAAALEWKQRERWDAARP